MIQRCQFFLSYTVLHWVFGFIITIIIDIIMIIILLLYYDTFIFVFKSMKYFKFLGIFEKKTCIYVNLK